ncbi:unnamed protein product [Trifolium pratense]|uniref:Uncharacterized protein n=1 Tax=Trifolium pratense TaxID=57577 RepID=A0ACB0JMB9_TRIPR|nr:unnamed protein product [Trifolium pratense]
MANGNRKNNTVWLYPQARKQYNSNDCGYYVMKNMLDIVTAKITDSWMEVIIFIFYTSIIFYNRVKNSFILLFTYCRYLMTQKS